MSGRLDDERLETLRSWGTGLAADGRDELRAAGKAILILIEEIERLQVDVWRPHDELSEPRPASVGEPELQAIAEPPARLDSTLSRRVRRLLISRSLKGR